MVLFVTGTCRKACWYCPLSKERKGHDRVYANEKCIATPGDAVAEARRMSALGTGVTGGEPLDKLDRVVEYCRALKRELGPGHQIHLYTALAPTRDQLERLSGLVDEIRLHPPHDQWETIAQSDFIASARLAKHMGFVTGIEVPSLPGMDLLEAALPYLDFLNINELEWGESNAEEMRRRGMVPEDGVHNAVMGAREWGAGLCSHQKVHWCSSGFKDSVQLRKRLLRIARNTARPFDEVTEDGTVVYGLVEGLGEVPEIIRELGDDGYELREEGLETAWWILAEHGDEISGTRYIVERYPDRGIIVEVTPL
ncbi:radical SAM protein [Methanolinea mesophila]|uniref:radical SAM protein n=1 Tax=Methanolinea mesophila TaxID=547055 RepID=UPI001AE9BAAA|nr:radical SAM protein [Methanolinea mesophila]